MCSSLTLPQKEKKEIKYYIFFPLGNIIWGSHQHNFLYLFLWKLYMIFFLDALYDFLKYMKVIWK